LWLSSSAARLRDALCRTSQDAICATEHLREDAMRKMRRSITASRNGRPSFALRMSAVALLLVAASVAGQADEAPGCQNLPAEQTVDTKWPINIGVLAPQLIRYRCTNYLKDFAAVTDEAHAWIAQRTPQVENAAVVFDIDETSLSNWASIYHNQFAYVEVGPCKLRDPYAFCGDNAWELSARAAALQPTLELFRFLKTVKDKNGKRVAVFFITGRFESTAERRATQRNLRKVGYDSWDGLTLRPQSTKNEDVAAYKSGVREEIEQRKERYTIIANLGDQYSDLIGNATGEHAERCFKLPNPFYFIGPALPDGGLKCLAR
jgi:hypothetical protein